MLREYLAFISYRHADNKELGRQWATWLHQTLETYEVPEDLVGKTNGRGEVIPARIYPIFRDEEELPADSDLANSITNALKQSRLLIVLCSPNAVASTYVADEIRYFKKLGHSDRIIAAMIDGEPNASWDLAKQAAGISPQAECFPVPLQFMVDEHGELTANRAEPIAADFRVNINNKTHQGWCNIEAFSQQLKELGHDNVAIKKRVSDYREQQKLMVLKIVAGILGVPLGELTQRDKAYQLELARNKAKRLARWLSGVVLLAVLALSAGFVAWTQKQLAIENENLAQQQAELAKENEAKAVKERDASLVNQSRFLLDQARIANDEGKHDLALLLGLNAVPGLYGGERPMPGSVSEIRRALYSGQHQVTITADEDIIDTMFSGSGNTFYVLTQHSGISVFDSKTGEQQTTFATATNVRATAFSPDETLSAVLQDNGDVIVLNTADRSVKYTLQFDERGSYYGNYILQFSSDSKLLIAANAMDYVYGWDLETGERGFRIQSATKNLDSLRISHDGKWFLGHAQVGGGFSIWSTTSGQVSYQVEADYFYMPDSRTPFFMGETNNVMFYNEKGTQLYDMEKKTVTQLTPQVHVIFNNNVEHALLLPANNRIQGTADEVNTIESTRKNPFWFNVKDKTMVQLNHFGDVDNVYFTPDNRYVITQVYQELYFWHQSSGGFSHKIKLGGTPSDVKIAKDGKFILAYFRDEDKVRVLEVEPAFKDTVFSEVFNDYSAKLSPRGKYAYLSTSNNGVKAKLINTRTFEDVLFLTDWCSSPKLVLFSNDESKLFFSCREDESKPFYILDLLTKTEITLALPDDEPYHTDSYFSPVGAMLLLVLPTYSDYDVALVAIEQQQAAPVLVELGFEKKPETIVFSHDGGIVGLKSQNTSVTFIDANSGQVINNYKSEKEIELFSVSLDKQSFFVHFSDNRTLQLAMADNTIINEFNTREQLADLIALPNNRVALIPESGDVAVWSAQDGTVVERISTKSNGADYAMSFDAKYLYKKGGKSVISLHDLGIFYQADDYSVNDVVLDEELDEIILLNGKGIKRLPAFSADLVARATERLSISNKCLSDRERERYFLSPLTTEQKQARNCQILP